MQRNVDTKQPVIRGSPRAADEGLFGYSLALHQLNVETDGFSDALQNTRYYRIDACMRNNIDVACIILRTHEDLESCPHVESSS